MSSSNEKTVADSLLIRPTPSEQTSLIGNASAAETATGETVVPLGAEDEATILGEPSGVPEADDAGTVLVSAGSSVPGEGQTLDDQMLENPTVLESAIGASSQAAGRPDEGQTGGALTDMGDSGLQPTVIPDAAGPTSDDAETIHAADRLLRAPAATKTPPDPRRYTLIDSFAQGGLGKIWLARDQRIQRDVAYKELRPNALRMENFLERFLEEAQITGQLEHPGIVPIYDLGWQDNGTPFYAMKLVRGITFKKAIEDCHALPRESSERKLAFVKRLGNFIDICNALAFAHDRGVVHRDLKPQNVMLGNFGETLVLDWGLAKIIGAPDRPGEADGSAPRAPADGESVTQPGGSVRQTVTSNVRSEGSQTLMGSVMGTPAYMPPEQARGQLHEIDARSDVYSLGAILYELLTNRQPIEKGKVMAMVQRVIAGDFPAPRTIDATIPKPLEAICLKAMARERADRYSGALPLARDVERYLADEPIDVYREPWPLRLKRWGRRHRTLVASGAMAALTLSVAWGAWTLTERVRLRQIRAKVHAAVENSRTSAAATDFVRSKADLNEALGIVRADPALADSEADIRDRLDQLDRLLADREANRVERVRSLASQKIGEAKVAFSSHEVELAATLLAEAATSLRGEAKLQDLRRDAVKHLAKARLVIAAGNAKRADQARFAQFKKNADRARFFASQFTGDRLRNNSEQAQTAAQAALQVYGFKPGSRRGPVSLPKAQRSEIENDAYELMIILAETETGLAADRPPAERRKASAASLDWLEQARALGRESRSLRLREARSLDELGRGAEANKARAVAESLKPTTALEFFLLAEFERKEGRYGAASMLYQQALTLDPNYFLALYSLGLCNLQRVQAADVPDAAEQVDFSGYLSAAVTAFTACLAQRPDFPWPYLLRAIAYADMQDFDEAFADFDRALGTKVDAAGVYDPGLYQTGILMNRGVVFLKQKRFREAEADFRQAQRLRPDSADPHINLALVLSQQKKDQLALSELTEASQLDSSRSLIYRLRAEVNLRLSAEPAAVADYEKAIELEPSVKARAPLYAGIGKMHHRAARWSEALAAYDQSLATDPDSADVIRLRGEVLLELKRDEEAVAAFSKYLALSKPVGDVYRARGLANAKLGHYRAAINDYTRSLELEPSPHMLTRRGWAYLLESQKLALEDFDDAIRLNPDNGDSYNGRGYAHVLLGDSTAAVADAEEAVKRGPKSFEIYYNASTIFAQAVAVAERNSKLPDNERKELATAFTRRAVELIGQAGELLGPKNKPLLLKTLESDRAIDPIRNAVEFKALVDDLAAK